MCIYNVYACAYTYLRIFTLSECFGNTAND